MVRFSKRIVRKIINTYKIRRAAHAEASVSLPEIVIVIGSQYSGADEVANYLSIHSEAKQYDELFLNDFHGWFPSMNNQTDKILMTCCNQTAIYHTRLLMKDLFSEDDNLKILKINTSLQVAQYPSIIESVKLIFPEAVFLHIVRNPLTEFAESRNNDSDRDNVIRFAYRWREAVREWIQFARSNTVSYYVISRDPELSTLKMEFKDHLLLKMAFKPRQTVVRWQSLREIGNPNVSFAVNLALKGTFEEPLEFPFQQSNWSNIPEPDRLLISEICVWEMRLLRHISVGASIPLTGEQWPKDEQQY